MAQVDTPAVAEADRNATSAAKSDTLLVTARRAHTEAVEEEDTVARAKVVMVVEATEVELVKDKLATRAEDTATCLATARKGKNATTV